MGPASPAMNASPVHHPVQGWRESSPQRTRNAATPSIAATFLGASIVFALCVSRALGPHPSPPDPLLAAEASAESADVVGAASPPRDLDAIEGSRRAESDGSVDGLEPARAVRDEGDLRRRETTNIFGTEISGSKRMTERGFTCYRTVDGTYQAMRRIERLHPNLAELVDIGDSYEKTAAAAAAADGGGDAGSDLWVLKLTNKSRRGGHRNKGIMFAVFGLHPREYAPVEVGMRFAQMLVGGYGTDADVTQVLDRTEVHLLLQANPDGRRVAEADREAWWRKNRNPTGGCEGGDFGVDLNRNFGFRWGWDGSGSHPCNVTYRGPRPFSEPETAAIARYSRRIFPPAQRRAFPEDRADEPYEDEDALGGTFVDVHAYGNFVVFPWVYQNEKKVPNHDAYRALGHKLCSFNRYIPLGSGYKPFSYTAPGGSLDYHWGVLGVPSFLFEVGYQLDEPCKLLGSVVERNLPSLLYAAKAARAPFSIAKGPDVIEIDLSARRIPKDGTLTVSALVSDLERTDLWGEDGVPTGGQSIRRVRLYLDGHPYDRPRSERRNMAPSDGRFDSPTERAELDVDASGLAGGVHTACVEATDSDGYSGAVSCASFGVGCAPEDCPSEVDCAAIRKKRRCRKVPACRWRRSTSDSARRSCVRAGGAAG